MEPWLAFYRPFFAAPEDAEQFVAACEAKSPPDLAAKIIMHQAQRLISIADDLPQIRPGQEALRLLFLLMCAENVSKLQQGYSGEGESRRYVNRFFVDFLEGPDKTMLSAAFTRNDELLSAVSFDDAVGLLYDVRCDVVHEGNYSGFVFHDGTTPMINTPPDPDVTSNVRLHDVRSIVVRGCIAAARTRL